MLAVGVLLLQDAFLVLFYVNALGGKGIVGWRMRPVNGLLEDIERVLLVHC